MAEGGGRAPAKKPPVALPTGPRDMRPAPRWKSPARLLPLPLAFRAPRGGGPCVGLAAVAAAAMAAALSCSWLDRPEPQLFNPPVSAPRLCVWAFILFCNL